MRQLLLLSFILNFSALAESGYCQLEQMPSVNGTINALLENHNEGKESYQKIELGEKLAQVTLSGMGDAFDFWGTDLLIFSLKDIKNFNKHTIAFKVSYSSFHAKEDYESMEGHGKAHLCLDTQEVNPKLMYFETADTRIEMIEL